MDPILMNIPEEIQTPRLRLRAPRVDEAEEMNRAICESVEELKPWMPWVDPVPTIQDTELYCRRSFGQFALRMQLDYRMYDAQTDLFLGNTGFPRLDWKVPSFEIGYWLRTGHTGRGYMTEAVTALTAFAFERLGAQRVFIHMDELNHRSRRVADRAGFGLEGVLRNHARSVDGKVRNTCVYSKIANPAD